MGRVRIVKSRETNKPVAVLRACCAFITTHGALLSIETMTTDNMPLGVAVFADVLREEPRFCFLHIRVAGYDAQGRGKVRTVKVVNWWSDDPPYTLSVIDIYGEQYNFSVIAAEVDINAAQQWQDWQAYRTRAVEAFATLDTQLQEEAMRLIDAWPDDY